MFEEQELCLNKRNGISIFHVLSTRMFYYLLIGLFYINLEVCLRHVKKANGFASCVISVTWYVPWKVFKQKYVNKKMDNHMNLTKVFLVVCQNMSVHFGGTQTNFYLFSVKE
jgi:hypothetical protein